MNLSRTLILVVTATMLSGCDLDHSIKVLEGRSEPEATPVAFLAIAPTEEAAANVQEQPAAPEPPHVPQCWWQAWQWYYCDGVYVEPQPHNPNFD